MRAIIFDVETTGMNEPEIIEAAWCGIAVGDGPVHVERFKPSKAIELGAMATHHILPNDLEGFPPSSDFKLPEGVEYLIGFNIDYDWKCAGEPPVKRIDLCAISRVLYPGLDSYRQSAVYYHLFGANNKSRSELIGAHNAETDVRNCYLIYCMIMQDAEEHGVKSDVENLWLYSEDCRIPRIMPFGKHKGEPIGNVPKGYRDWYSKQADTDPLILSAFDKFPCEA